MTHVSHILCPFIIDEHIGYLHILAIRNKPSINIRASISFLNSVLIFKNQISRSKLARLYGSSTFNL